jgi:hypothetical protein
MSSTDLKAAREYCLSDEDVNTLLSPNTRIVVYTDLYRMNRMDDALDGLGRCILLLPVSSPTSGHWVSLWKEGDVLHYFDPYGYPPETFREWIRPAGRAIGMGLRHQVLLELLKTSGYDVRINQFPYQRNRDDINTCGRHCVTRLMLKDYDAKAYHNIVAMSKKSPDDFVTLFTLEQLGK